MRSFKYADEKINERELMIAVPSVMIGVGILTLPMDLASVTTSSDGWVSMLVGGFIAIVLAWMFTKFALRFPGQSFLSYSSLIVTKPVAIILSFLFGTIWLGITAFEVRKIAEISKQYLFDRTPVEVIALSFLLVIVYAVSGTRVGIFRLNMLFLPIILFIAFLVIVLNVGEFSPSNLLPMFETNVSGYLKGIHTVVLSYVGFSIVLFYAGLIKKPTKDTPKKVALGMFIPIILYLVLFMMSIGTFGHAVTSNLLYPTIELAKGSGTIKRFESIFFVIWIMAIFNTTTIALDITVLAINSIFKKIQKVKLVLILSPIVYAVSMFPQNVMEVSTLGMLVSNTALVYGISVTILLIVFAKLRGVKRVG